MTKTQLLYIAQFLKELSGRFGSDGCNDFEMPNTPENVELLCDAVRWNSKKEGGQDAREIREEASNGAPLCTFNFLLCDYLAYLAKREANGSSN